MAQSQYATNTELQQLAITAAAGARFGSTAMDAALQAASSIADSYLSSQFVLPLQTTPTQGWDMSLKLQVCNIAAYLLYCQFGFNPAAPGDQLIKERYDRAMSWLDGVGKKTITPVYTDSSGITPGADVAGDFIISDNPVGFTSRGTDVDTISDTCWWW